MSWTCGNSKSELHYILEIAHPYQPLLNNRDQLLPTALAHRDPTPMHIPPRRHLQPRQRPPRAPRPRRRPGARSPLTTRHDPRHAHLPRIPHASRPPLLRARPDDLAQRSARRPGHAAAQLPGEPEHGRPLRQVFPAGGRGRVPHGVGADRRLCGDGRRADVP